MKKTLLPILSLMLLATSASAQKLGTELFKNSLESNFKFAPAKTLNGFSAKTDANAPKKIKSDEVLISYSGADTPYNAIGWPGQSVQAVGAQMGSISQYVGYEVVGIRYAAYASLGEGAFGFAYVYNKSGSYSGGGEADITSSEISSVNSNNELDLKWNDLYFDEPYTITDNDMVLQYGYGYVQESDQNSDASYPVLYGETDTYSDNGEYGGSFIVYVNSQWALAANESNLFTPCIQVIAKSPNGETAIIGVKGSENAVASKYYNASGALMSAPQKGLNIVKMSDGTSRKVVLGK